MNKPWLFQFLNVISPHNGHFPFYAADQTLLETLMSHGLWYVSIAP